MTTESGAEQQSVTIIKAPWDLIAFRHTGVALGGLVWVVFLIAAIIITIAGGWTILVSIPLAALCVLMIGNVVSAWREIASEQLVITPTRIEYQTQAYHLRAAWSDVGYIEQIYRYKGGFPMYLKLKKYQVEWTTSEPHQFFKPNFAEGIPLDPFDGKKNAALMALIRQHAPHAFDKINL